MAAEGLEYKDWSMMMRDPTLTFIVQTAGCIAATALICLASACSGPASFQNGGATIALSAADISAQLTSLPSGAGLSAAHFRSLRLRDFIDQLAAQASKPAATISIDGVTLPPLDELLKAARANAAEIDGQFANIGAWLNSMGVVAAAAGSPAQQLESVKSLVHSFGNGEYRALAARISSKGAALGLLDMASDFTNCAYLANEFAKAASLATTEVRSGFAFSGDGGRTFTAASVVLAATGGKFYSYNCKSTDRHKFDTQTAAEIKATTQAETDCSQAYGSATPCIVQEANVPAPLPTEPVTSPPPPPPSSPKPAPVDQKEL